MNKLSLTDLPPRTHPHAALRVARGASVIKMLLVIPVALVLLLALVFAFFEGRKAYWDYRVREMCARDGGTHVSEQVSISKQEALLSGILVGNDLVIPSRTEEKMTSGYYIEYESSNIRLESPRVFRAQSTVVRARDRKILAEMITYFRVGGDFPSFAHPSTKTCSDADRALNQFRATIRIEKEDK